MKEWFFLILFLTLVISGCQTNGQSNNNPDYEPESGDVVDKHGNISNLDKFNMFVDHIKQGEKDKIRIVHYTKEGDAICTTLTSMVGQFIQPLTRLEMSMVQEVLLKPDASLLLS
jgi:hypothetical protein